MTLVDLVLRVALMVVASWNILWSAHGARQLARGAVSPPYFYLAFTFYANLAFVMYMIRYYLSTNGAPPSIWSLLLLALSIVAAVICAIGHHAGSDLKAKQFYSLYDALPQAIAIATLTRYDRDAADRLAEQCYTLTAAKIGTGISRDDR